MVDSSRREARERALSLLYEAEVKDLTPAELLEELPVRPEEFVVELICGVGDDRERIEDLIARFAIGWPTERMPAIDRNILRLATFELLGRPEIPVGAVLSEAVELAKRYSTDDSSRFVNGVLAAVAKEVRG